MSTIMKPQLRYPSFDLFNSIDENKYLEFKGFFTVQDDTGDFGVLKDMYFEGLVEGAVEFKPFIKIKRNTIEYTYKYIEDFLRPILKESVDRLSSDIVNECSCSNYTYTLEQKEGFLDGQVFKLRELMEEYKSCSFFNSDIEREEVLRSIKQLIDKVFSYKEKLGITYKKINFNIQQNHLLLLFRAFYDLGIISGIDINALMEFLQNHTTYRKKGLKNPKDQLRKEVSKRDIKNFDKNKLHILIDEILPD